MYTVSAENNFFHLPWESYAVRVLLSMYYNIVANRPGMAGTVPEFGPVSRLCPGLPDMVAMSRNTARLHKSGCGSSINLVY